MARSNVDQTADGTSQPVAGPTLGVLIRDARVRRGLTPTDLGVALGIQNRKAAYRRVRSWESGEGQPSREYVLTIARVLDVDLRDWAGAIAGVEPKGDGWTSFRKKHKSLFESTDPADVATVRYLRSFWLSDGINPPEEWYEAQLNLYRLLPK